MSISNISEVSRQNILKINGIQFETIRSINEFYLIPPVFVWSMGVSLNENRRGRHGACGSFNAAFIFGGYNTNFMGTSEEFNGTAWSAGGTFTARHYVGAAGTQTAALCSGGLVPGISECLGYNGTAWSSEGSLSTARLSHSGCGSATSALAISGNVTYPFTSANTLTSVEEYNGTSWSAGGNHPDKHGRGASVGLQNAALSLCGSLIYAGKDEVYSYNGTTWASENSTNAGRSCHGASGDQTSAVIFGGANAANNAMIIASEEWNGTSWSVKGDVSTGRQETSGTGGLGYRSAAMYIGGGLGTPNIASDTVEIYGQE